MGTLETVLLLLLVADAIALGVLVLLQQGKGADIGAAFGSGAANTVFGSAGSASFLAKLTTWLAIGFFVISFGLAYFAKERALALRDEGMPRIDTTEPAAPVQSTEATKKEEAPPQLTPPEETVDSDIPEL
jgi:preprotein translocase subunit SecG